MINHCRFLVNAETVFIINLLNYSKIPLKKITQNKSQTIFYVSSAHTDTVVKILEDRGKEYKILKDGSIKNFFKTNIFRFGIYAGILAVVLFMYFYASTLTRVQISGNKIVPQDVIYKAVDDFLEIPGFNKDADIDKLTKNIIALDGISSASVERKGNTLFVKVYEELPKVDVEDKTVYADVVSKYDSIVTRVVTFSGTCKVKKGDSIRKGQTIISATVEIGENLVTPEYANGIAYGRVWITKEIVIEPTYMEAERTGNSVNRVVFFNKQDTFKPSYEQYEVEKTTCYLNSVIPLMYTVYTYYETKNVIKEMNFSENEQAIVEKYSNALYAELPSERTVIRNWYDTKILDKNIKLVIYYDIETKIT
ncbi:MAG TPA: sporulation protein YqfD [Clostridia bacterium]|nr:sporulation protein YqfD [Clostridia bacterium]